MIVLKKATSFDTLGPGMWWLDDKGYVIMRCGHAEHSDKQPRYGQIFGRTDDNNWSIAPDGTVTPSIYFPDAACGWHEFVKLEGWVP